MARSLDPSSAAAKEIHQLTISARQSILFDRCGCSKDRGTEPTPAPAPEGKARRTSRLTHVQIDRAIAFERPPFRSKLLDMLDRPGSVINDEMKDRLRRNLARAAQHVEELHDIRTEYKERVLRRFVENGYVEVTDHEDDQDGDDDAVV